MWLAVMVLPTTNCLAISATCSVAAVLATSSACSAAPHVSHPQTQRVVEVEVYKGGIEASMKKADDLVVSVRHGHCGFLRQVRRKA